MRVLVVGGGGREHALCYACAKSELTKKVFCAPGNAGIADVAETVSIASRDHKKLVEFARRESIDLTVVGPEVPLCEGIQDHFSQAGLLLFGPTPEAAQIEGSKAFSKALMREACIPTAAYGVFDNPADAQQYISDNTDALVVKVDGLAAGKGVYVTDTVEDAQQAVRLLFDVPPDAAVNRRVVVEQRLKGEEVSVIALCDGERAQILESSQDYKRAYDGDQGPNTGGMGTLSPAHVLTPRLADRVQRMVIQPVLDVMASRGTPYRGVLYAGLMIVQGDPYVLEFNCRFGDPETQPLMMRLQSDIVPFLFGAAQGDLPRAELRWDTRSAVCVVLAQTGYPGKYETGVELDRTALAGVKDNDVMIFHAGTVMDGDRLCTAGGRVLGVTALGETLQVARTRAYAAVERVRWPSAHFRFDIAKKKE